MTRIWGIGNPSDIRVFMIDFTKLTLLIGMMIMLATNASKSDEICSQAKYEVMKDTLECKMEKISWVEVTFDGKLLEGQKAEYESLVRLRLRNDLSMIKHETVRFGDAVKRVKFNYHSSELKKKGAISCLVWTVGDDYPVAQFVECELWGYGKYSFRSKFSHRTLGYSNSNKTNEQVRSSIRGIIANISAKFLEARDMINQ